MNVRLEFITSDRADAAIALLTAQLQEHHIYTPDHLLRQVVERVCANAREGFMLLASGDGGEPVGIAFAASHLSAEHGGIVGWLEELYVQPEYRGRGVGGALLSSVIAEAQRREWRALDLEVVAGHERAVALYQRHQFAPVNRQRFTRFLDGS
jgi:GNAT superfamily N-acetyltransferase